MTLQLFSLDCCLLGRSQEVWDNLADGYGTARVLRSVEDLKVALQVLVDVEDGGDVATAVAVVRCGPNRHQVRVFEPVLKAIHDELVSPGHQLQVINVVELRCDLGAEKPAGTSGRDRPSVDVLWVRPHQVTEGSLVGHFHPAVNQAHLIESLDLR